jgi:hypothetical protein
MSKPLNAIEQPDLRRFLATLPEDGELRRRADAFAATIEPLAAVRQRPREIVARIAAIDAAFIDAGAKEGAALLAERATLAAELAALPVKAEALARRYALAELGYLSRARALVHAEGTACAAAQAPHQNRASAIRKSMTLMESSLRNGAEKFAELAKLREELGEVASVANPLHARVNAAEGALGLIDGLARQRYGEGIVVAQEGAHAPGALAYGQRIVRALRAA